MGRRDSATYQSQLVSVLPLAAWTPGRSAAEAARRREMIARILVAGMLLAPKVPTLQEGRDQEN